MVVSPFLERQHSNISFNGIFRFLVKVLMPAFLAYFASSESINYLISIHQIGVILRILYNIMFFG